MSSNIMDGLGRWIVDAGPAGDVVFASRVRLARNLDAFKFPPWASDVDKEGVLSALRPMTTVCKSLSRSEWLDMSGVGDLNRAMLVERHLISVEHSTETERKAVVIDPTQCISIMINEEDHLRLQTLQPGLRLMEAWQIASQIDDELADWVPYAFSQQWGFLTSCPSNLGTGLRASCLLHLAGLAHSKTLAQILNASQKLGLVVRGFYGEGSQSMGNLVQISNQASLGVTEAEILKNLKRRVHEIVGCEKAARNALFSQRRMEMEDKVWRAWGILTHARMMTSQDAMELFSDVLLGVETSALQVSPSVSRPLLSELMMLIQPGHLQYRTGKELSPEERDVARAEMIRSRLSSSG